MQETHAPHYAESIDVRTSSVALPYIKLNTETDSICQGESSNTNRFTDLARVADRIQTSGCHG
eukprot:9158646-Pyramimonas_sp.AAC.1